MAISINLYLNNRLEKKRSHPEDEEFPVKLSITKNGRTAYIPTGVKVRHKQWKNRQVTGRKDKARLNTFLESFKSHVKLLVYSGLEDGRYHYMSATKIKKDILFQLGKEDRRGQSELFLTIYDRFAESRSSERTKEIYRVTGRKIRQLLPCPEKIRLDQIDLDWLENLDELLIARGNNGTTGTLIFGIFGQSSSMPKSIGFSKNHPLRIFSCPSKK